MFREVFLCSLCILLAGTAVHGQNTGGQGGATGSATTTTTTTTTSDSTRCPGSTVVPDNGALGTCANSVAAGATCSITCNSGFAVTGDPKACPAAGGTLTGADQTCVGNPCTAPTAAPENGALGTCTGSIAHGSSCSITCNDGYHIDGSNYKCFAGTLTGTQTCIGDPCTPLSTPPQDGGAGTCGGGGQPIASGTTCSITCDTGFTVTGAARTCTGGVWSGSVQTCLGNPCDALTVVPLHGAVGTCGVQILHGSSCSITCDQGYQISGSTAVTCKAGAFDGAAQSCQGMPCAPLSNAVANGELATCGTQISSGNTCSITCHQGYHIKGALTRTCTASILGGDDQSCEGDPCQPILFPPENGAVGTCGAQIQSGSECDIECNPGYHRQDGPFNCNAGVLSVPANGKPQTCQGNSCGALATPPENGVSGTCGSTVAHQGTCSIVCNQGFKLSDDSPTIRRCVAGAYLDSAQSCTLDPGYQDVQAMRAGFQQIQADDAKAAKDTADIATQKAVQAKILADHAAEVEAQRKILFPTPPWQNIQPQPHSYKPININNQYTYDQVYMPPQTSTDQNVITAAEKLDGGLDALHESRVESMQTACAQKTCDYTPETTVATSSLLQQQVHLSNAPLNEPNAVDVATNAPEPINNLVAIQLGTLLKSRKRILEPL